MERTIGYLRDDGKVICLACGEKDIESDQPVIHDYIDITAGHKVFPDHPAWQSKPVTCDLCGTELEEEKV